MRRLLSLLGKKLRGSEDPTVARALWTLVVSTLVAIVVLAVLALKDHGNFSNDLATVLKLAGAIVVLLGSYFAARTIGHNRDDQVANRYMRAVELLGHSQPDVRLGAVQQLDDIGTRVWKHTRGGEGYPGAVRAVLAEFARTASAKPSPGTPIERGADVAAAERALAKLPEPDSG